MDKSTIKDRVKTIASKRQVEELDELIEECEKTFPE